MKVVKYSLYIANRATDDPERAVLPTILYARKREGISTATAAALGWWAWGIGIIRTVTEVKE